MVKAVALVSGGLDSILAAAVIKKLGVEVMGVHFRVPFVLRSAAAVAAHEREIEGQAQESGVPVRIIAIGEEFLEMVRHPKFGRGKNMNPCIDCRIFMLRKAKQYMEEQGASFLITGEVVAQRPMSQHRVTMFSIDKEAGVEGLNLRPLSARILPETIPEQKGWVDRSKLFDLNGRGRRQQIDMAVMMGIVHFPQPAGGCLLTDPIFSRRLRDLMKTGAYTMNDIDLLKVGRHFKIAPAVRLTVGRDERENMRIQELAQPGDYILVPEEEVAGPTAVVRGVSTESDRLSACRVMSRYCDRGGRVAIGVMITPVPEGERQEVMVEPAPESELDRLRV